MIKEGTISPHDLDLFAVLDDADAIVDYIFQHYERTLSGPLMEDSANYMEL
jgi:hypothetical protein